MVALVTPFKDGRLDLEAMRKLVDWHLSSGTHGIVVCGTTGEASTMSEDERRQAITCVVKAVNRRIPVIAGTGANDTARTVAETRAAEELGVDGALVVTPYYNKPTQRGLIEHYRAVAAATRLPIILYNVPGRTGVSLAPETVATLAKEKNIAAIKEAGGSVDAVSAIRHRCELPVLSGDDALTLPMMAVGAVGVISVLANVMPAETAALCTAFRAGDLARAREMHYKVYGVAQALFLESNPIPAKTALRLMGRIGPELRLPLCAMSEENEKKLGAALRAAGVLPA